MAERKRVVKAIHAYEMLDDICKQKDPVAFAKALNWYGSKPPLNFILSLNFNHTVVLELPEGMPPLDLKDMDAQTHPDLMGLLSSSISNVRHCVKDNKLTKNKKEQLFYDVLINCPLKDAEILCSAKDHALEELYPKITAEMVAVAFPAYVKSA